MTDGPVKFGDGDTSEEDARNRFLDGMTKPINPCPKCGSEKWYNKGHLVNFCINCGHEEKVKGREASYNCPTCRYDCAPGAKDELTCHQTKHCDYHEERRDYA